MQAELGEGGALGRGGARRARRSVAGVGAEVGGRVVSCVHGVVSPASIEAFDCGDSPGSAALLVPSLCADAVEPLFDAVQARGLVLAEAQQLLRVAGLGLVQLGVNHRQLLPFLGELSRPRGREVAALVGGLPLAEPEGAILGPALRLVGVVVRDELEVLEVAREAVRDVASSSSWQLSRSAAVATVADGRARGHGVAAPVDRDRHRHEQVRAPQRDERQDEPRNEPPVRAELAGRRRSVVV